MVCQDALVVSVRFLQGAQNLLFGQRAVNLRLQDIVHLLLVESEVADLNITVEQLRLERHWWGLRVLIFIWVVRAVNDLLRPDLLIANYLLNVLVMRWPECPSYKEKSGMLKGADSTTKCFCSTYCLLQVKLSRSKLCAAIGRFQHLFSELFHLRTRIRVADL